MIASMLSRQLKAVNRRTTRPCCLTSSPTCCCAADVVPVCQAPSAVWQTSRLPKQRGESAQRGSPAAMSALHRLQDCTVHGCISSRCHVVCSPCIIWTLRLIPQSQSYVFCPWCDPAAQVLADIRPNEEHAANHILRNPIRVGVQAVPSRSEHDVSVLRTTYCRK